MREMEEVMERILRGGQFKILFERQISELRKKYNLKKSEIEILYFLSKCGQNNTSTDIRKHLKMNKGHISQTVDVLCKKGFLVAVSDRKDRRYIHYSLTDKADEVIREISVVWDRMMQIVFDGISEEEMIVFRNIAEKIGKNMDYILEHV